MKCKLISNINDINNSYYKASGSLTHVRLPLFHCVVFIASAAEAEDAAKRFPDGAAIDLIEAHNANLLCRSGGAPRRSVRVP